jgi:hypothetical protein
MEIAGAVAPCTQTYTVQTRSEMRYVLRKTELYGTATLYSTRTATVVKHVRGREKVGLSLPGAHHASTWSFASVSRLKDRQGEDRTVWGSDLLAFPVVGLLMAITVQS